MAPSMPICVVVAMMLAPTASGSKLARSALSSGKCYAYIGSSKNWCWLRKADGTVETSKSKCAGYDGYRTDWCCGHKLNGKCSSSSSGSSGGSKLARSALSKGKCFAYIGSSKKWCWLRKSDGAVETSKSKCAGYDGYGTDWCCGHKLNGKCSSSPCVEAVNKYRNKAGKPSLPSCDKKYWSVAEEAASMDVGRPHASFHGEMRDRMCPGTSQYVWPGQNEGPAKTAWAKCTWDKVVQCWYGEQNPFTQNNCCMPGGTHYSTLIGTFHDKDWGCIACGFVDKGHDWMYTVSFCPGDGPVDHRLYDDLPEVLQPLMSNPWPLAVSGCAFVLFFAFAVKKVWRNHRELQLGTAASEGESLIEEDGGRE